MNPEEQRIAIALACGAKWRLFESGYTFLTFAEEESGFTDVDAPADPAKIVISETVPDYLGSLDAMNEAEKVLTPDQFHDYRGWLWKITTAHLSDKPAAWIKVADRAYLTATASQRAEAFLRTLNLWTE